MTSLADKILAALEKHTPWIVYPDDELAEGDDRDVVEAILGVTEGYWPPKCLTPEERREMVIEAVIDRRRDER